MSPRWPWWRSRQSPLPSVTCSLHLRPLMWATWSSSSVPCGFGLFRSTWNGAVTIERNALFTWLKDNTCMDKGIYILVNYLFQTWNARRFTARDPCSWLTGNELIVDKRCVAPIPMMHPNPQWAAPVCTWRRWWP